MTPSEYVHSACFSPISWRLACFNNKISSRIYIGQLVLNVSSSNAQYQIQAVQVNFASEILACILFSRPNFGRYSSQKVFKHCAGKLNQHLEIVKNQWDSWSAWEMCSFEAANNCASLLKAQDSRLTKTRDITFWTCKELNTKKEINLNESAEAADKSRKRLDTGTVTVLQFLCILVEAVAEICLFRSCC